MASNQQIITDFNTFYSDSYATWNPFFAEAERDLRFFLGDQWQREEKDKLFQEGRNAFVFNKIRRTLNMVSGYQRKNRLSSVVIPIEDSDQKTSDQLSKLLLYVMGYGEGYQVISDCFGGALKTGWNFFSMWIDYRDDPINGDIRFSREPYNAFIVDPYLTKLDFSDCAYILSRKYMGLAQTISLLPEHSKELKRLDKYGWEKDDKFTWLPYQRNPNGQTLLAYNELHQQKWRNVPMLVDMETGETLEFDRGDDAIGQFLSIYPQLKVIQRPQRYIEKHIIVNDEHIKTEINPFGLDEYPYVPISAIFEPESDQWELKLQSLSRCLIDPQRESNKRRSQMSDLLDSQINSGYIAEEDSVINPRSLFQTSQGRVIWKKKNTQPGAIEKIQPAQIPPSMFQLQELFDRDLMEIAGVNDAAFGQTENANDSGVMMMLRQGASIINLQELFDNLRLSQKNISKKVLKLIQQWDSKKIQRILNEAPTEQFYEKDFTKYDVSIQEGILTDSQRQMYFRQLVDLKQLGVPVTGEMLAKAAPIQGKSIFLEELAQVEKQQAEAAQKQAQVQQQLMQTQSQSAQAKAINDLAGASERKARTHSNLALSTERISESEQNRSQAALERAKTIVEIAKMEDERLFKFLDYVRLLEAEEIEDREAIARKVGAQTEKIIMSTNQDQQVINTPTSGQVDQQQGALAGQQ
ncbi:MAG: hypothetical protein A2W23_02640 [Planctomycetes bacterium RBG_16_43_13]|nr:MAG: hypothetical protein A2W23_02640 [Planctomycetes bacterium RBG_16_43_13]